MLHQQSRIADREKGGGNCQNRNAGILNRPDGFISSRTVSKRGTRFADIIFLYKNDYHTQLKPLRNGNARDLK